MSVYFSPHKVKLLSTGSALPGNCVTNEALFEALTIHAGNSIAKKAKRIVSRLGINQRYLARSLKERIECADPSNPELCQRAIENALRVIDEPIKPGYLIGHTASPHTLIPPNISWVAEKLQHEAPYLELRQACTGFANALQIAAPMLSGDTSLQSIVIVGSETGSVYFDCQKNVNDIDQLINYVQMGDGAAAAIISADDGSKKSIIQDIYLGHIGLDKQSGFYLNGGSNKPNCEVGESVHRFSHHTSEVFQHGAKIFEMGLNSVLARGYKIEDFAYILPHQANGLMAKYISKGLGVPKEKVVVDADKVGNMGSAAIWYSFDQLLKSKKRLQRGDKVLVLGAEATKYLYGGFVYQH